MKTKFQIITFAAVAIAALTSCAKEEFTENAIPAGEPIEVSLNGQIGEFTPADATKATAESVVRVTWGSGDKVYVYDGGNASIGTLTVTPDDNNASYAMLSGTIKASAASPSKLTLVYVKGATAAPDIAGGKISVDLSSQDEAEVPFVLYTTVAYDAAALTKTNEYISFSFATSVMTVNCTGLQTGDSGAVADINKAEIDGVSTACELTIDGTGVTAVAGTTPGKITRTAGFTQSDSRGSFRLALAADPTAPAAPAARNILVHQGSKVSGSPFTTATLAAGKSYNTVYQMTEYVSIMLPGGFTVNAQGKKVYFSKGNLYCKRTSSTSNDWTWHFYDEQYQYNSISITSGQRTAAATDTEIDLFTWGYNATYSIDPIGYDYVTGHSIDGETFTKNEDWGYVFGGESSVWRTLTREEWMYLFATDTDSPRYNRHKLGVKICGKENCMVLLPDNWDETVISLTSFASQMEYNENSAPTWAEMAEAGAVCLPAAGQRYGTEVIECDGKSYYWSSSATDMSAIGVTDNAAAYVTFDGSEVWEGAFPGLYGYSVRLVTESSDGYSPTEKVTGVSLNKNETTIEAGATEKLVATVTPANAANKHLNWKSSDENVATVIDGVVIGVAVGSAVITATTADGNFTAVCLVTVTDPVPLTGLFSVSSNKKVRFSKGNLRATYNGTLYIWGFAANQYDYIGNAPGNTTIDSQVPNAVVDLFGWIGNSSIFTTSPEIFGITTIINSDNGHYGNVPSEPLRSDWGKNIGDGSTWRTLTTAEWQYLFSYDGSGPGGQNYDNDTRRGKYKHGVTVCGKENCVVLLPDEWNTSVISLENFASTSNYSEETSPKWSAMEAAGAVCLPAAGQRSSGSEVCDDNSGGYYWSSTSSDNSSTPHALYVYFSSNCYPDSQSWRENGCAVRLVTECQ